MSMTMPEIASEAPAVAADGSDASLLEIRNLKTYFPIRSGILRGVVGQVMAVDDVSFEIRRGEGVWLRQNDARPDRPAARGGHGRDGDLRRAGRHCLPRQ